MSTAQLRATDQNDCDKQKCRAQGQANVTDDSKEVKKPPRNVLSVPGGESERISQAKTDSQSDCRSLEPCNINIILQTIALNGLDKVGQSAGGQTVTSVSGPAPTSAAQERRLPPVPDTHRHLLSLRTGRAAGPRHGSLAQTKQISSPAPHGADLSYSVQLFYIELRMK